MFIAKHRNIYPGPRGRRAFTLVEILAVLVILATLAAIVLPKVVGRTEQANITAATTQIKAFCTALDTFEVDNGYFPKGKDGLQALVTAPKEAKNWRGPYLDSIPLDPWGSPYVFECPGKNNPKNYDIYSIGPDKTPGTADDITNWKSAK